LKGLELVGPKLKSFVVAAQKYPGALYLYCWRGGMRSNSMAWLLSTAGREVYVLEGGYKAYRGYMRDLFAGGLKLIMLSGPTGSGKTEILHELSANGHQVIDLEGLANHKGSSFGALGQDPQPSTEQFTNLLFEKVAEMDLTRPIWVEGESQFIGKVFILDELFDQMNRCPAIRIDPPRHERIERLVRDYASFPVEMLEYSIEKISKRLGGKDTKDAINALHAVNYHDVVDITLAYYDKTYDFSMARRENVMLSFVSSTYDPKGILPELLRFVEENISFSD
jgi:tRNA 2-selenouridine synthase